MYKPRSGGVNKNKDKYTDDQMKFIMENLEDLLHFWGYTRTPDAPIYDFGFFDYP